MIKKILPSKIISLLILLFFAVTNFSSSQTVLHDSTTKKITEMTEKLSNKLLLSDVQKDKVKIILQDYFINQQKLSGDNAGLTELQKTSEAKIVNILDSKQKMKYDIVKKEWWNLATH